MEDAWGYVVIAVVGALGIGFWAGTVAMYEFCKRHVHDLELEVENDKGLGDD